MPPFSTSSARWTAITTRDPAASNAFVYCVTSTKIYCRPTCPARLARRANVVFHDTAAEAETAGYRACRRCRPGEGSEGDVDPQKIAVARACDLVRKEGSDGERWSVKGLGTEVGLTESHFCRVFKKITGLTVGEFRASIVRKKPNLKDIVVSSKSGPAFWNNGGAEPSSEFPYPGPAKSQNSFMDFDSLLVRDWYDLSGTNDLVDAVDMFLRTPAGSLGDFDLSHERISEASTLTTTDDGFQFLNFEAV